jgi:hypothetical protein
MKCAQCNQTTEAGLKYGFYYGKKLASHSQTNTKYRGSSAVTTTQTNTTFQINGSGESYICNSCVVRKAMRNRIENGAIGMVLSALVVFGALQFSDTGFIALIFSGVFMYSVINTIISILKLNKLRRASKNGNLPIEAVLKYELNTVGSSLAINIYKKALGKQLDKNDAFITPDVYAKLK